MAGTTSINKFPFPEDKDAPDGPTQIKALAEALDILKWGSRNFKPTLGVVAANADLTLSPSFQDVPGTELEITPAVASVLAVIAIFDLEAGNSDNAAATGLGTIRLDSTDQTPEAQTSITTPGQHAIRETASQVYLLSLTAAKHTVKARAKAGGGASGACKKAGTRYLYLLAAS